MSDGKAFTIWCLRYTKADISNNTPKALKTEPRRDFLDETMGKFSVVNRQIKEAAFWTRCWEALQQCLWKQNQVKYDFPQLYKHHVHVSKPNHLRHVQWFKSCPSETNGSGISFSDTIFKHILFSEDFFVLCVLLRGKMHLQLFPSEQSIKSLKQIHLHFHLHFSHLADALVQSDIQRPAVFL